MGYQSSSVIWAGSLYIRNAVGVVVIGLTLFGASTKPLHADPIRAATDEWPPFRILTDEGFTGLDLDLIHEVGKRIGTEVDVVRMPWGRGLASMQTGAVDVMTGLAYRKERAEYIAYTDTPYYACETAFYTPASRPVSITAYEDLREHTVGFVLHSAYFEQFDQDTTLDKLGVAAENILIDMTKRGRLDVMIGTDCQVDYYLKTQGLGDRIVKTEYRPGNTVNLFLGVSRQSEWAERVDELNAIVKDLVDEGIVDAFARRYYDNPS